MPLESSPPVTHPGDAPPFTPPLRPPAPWTLLVWTPQPPRCGLIEGIAARCQASTAHCHDPDDIDTGRLAANSAIALVALGADCGAGPDGRSLAIIGRLKSGGYTVVAHERGTEGWGLGMRCKVLAAGAAHLLDSGRDGFAAELESLLKQLLAQEAARQGEERQIREFMASQGVVGTSRHMANLFRQILRVGPLSDLPVLVTGESGTGKELVARALHRLDPKRRDGPFVALNCGAISAGVAESELFGHKKGAFTGAGQTRKGLFQAARQGVLFLDEIGELSLDLQVKLLRVLQEGRVLGVGHDEDIAVNCRIIAATHRDFAPMLERKEFRLDLYHRLNVLALHIPPLRERPEDIKALIGHILEHKRPADGPPPTAGADFIDALACLPLPGNARELENIVRRALLGKQDGAPLALSDLPAEALRQLSELAPPAAAAPEPAAPADGGLCIQCLVGQEPAGWDLCRLMAEFESRLVAAALRQAGGNQTRVAQLLGITPRSVYNKLKKYRLE